MMSPVALVINHYMSNVGTCWIPVIAFIRATSHMRLRAHDQNISSTLVGGKGGASPSLFHTTLEGPTE